eukprot:469811-Pyramimonas_sp.AAC.1
MGATLLGHTSPIHSVTPAVTGWQIYVQEQYMPAVGDGERHADQQEEVHPYACREPDCLRENSAAEVAGAASAAGALRTEMQLASLKQSLGWVRASDG